jgi:hypothetical protein
MTSTTTIGFVPRERFSAAAEALQSIYDHTNVPFDLLIVDCAIPATYRRQMEEVLAGRNNVRVLSVDHYLLPNQSRNVVLRNSMADWVCLIENDVLVEPGWLERLIAACQEELADVAAPLIMERLSEFEKVHFDDRLGRVEEVETGVGMGLRILPPDFPKDASRDGPRQRAEFLETHCVLFRGSVLQRVQGFDEMITAQEEIDMSLCVRHAGLRMIVEPRSVVTFLPPPPIYPDEKDYYLLKWNPQTYAQDYERVARKWNLVDPPSAMGVVRTRRRYAQEPDPAAQLERELAYRRKVQSAAEDIAALVPAGGTFILVHESELDLGDVAPDRRVLPFIERNGAHWGPPADSATAILELERMRSNGVPLIAIAWPSFWWLSYYTEFAAYLRAHHPCLLENDRLVAFALQRERVVA